MLFFLQKMKHFEGFFLQVSFHAADVTSAGLPDGLFSNQKYQFGQILECLRFEDLIYFMAICNILRTFGIFNDHLVHFVFFWYIFSGFGFMYQEESGNLADVNKSDLNGKRLTN
jgi:hypothetical protein